MEEEATSSTQPANPVQETSAHLTSSDYEKQNKADQHWLAIGVKNVGAMTSVAKFVSNGILFKVAIRITGRQRIGLIDSGASHCYMSPETIALCELLWHLEMLYLELADSSKVQSTQKAKNVNVTVGKSIF